MISTIHKRNNKTMHLAEAFYTNLFVQPLLPLISKTNITPNNITMINIGNSFFMYYLAFNGNFKTVAILIQVYLFLDILDGNLARYKNMHSKLGAKLDSWCDTIFYNMIFISIGYGRVNLVQLILVLILVNTYALIATYYIVPRLRMIKEIKRFGLKRKMMEKGYIIGMDLGTVDFITTVFLILGRVDILYTILIAGYIFDLIYRVFELKYNEKCQ